MRGRPNWENYDESEDSQDRLHIGKALFPPGFAFMWVTDIITATFQTGTTLEPTFVMVKDNVGSYLAYLYKYDGTASTLTEGAIHFLIMRYQTI